MRILTVTSWCLALALFAGCTTHPVAHVLDCVAPGKMGKNKVAPYGGVCCPSQGQESPFQPPMPAPGSFAPGAPITPPVTVPVIPPPAPLPSVGPPPGSAIPPVPPPPPSFPR